MPKPYRSERTTTAQPEIYKAADIRAVMEACASNPTGRRDRLAIMLMWCAGLKSKEICSLRVDAFDKRRGVVDLQGLRPDGLEKVLVPKAQRPELWSVLGAWIKSRSTVLKRKSNTLICNLNGQPLDDSYYRRILPRLAERAGVGRRFHAQGLRQTFAAAMHRDRFPMEIIRRQLGLTDIAYTAALVDRIYPVEVFVAMENFTLE